MKEKWYKGVYRRNLVDIHVADWNDDFMGKFNPDEYYNNMKKAHVQSPMIYLQSHTGISYYPSKSGYTHKYFRENPRKMNELIDKCQAGGMKVVAYYSLIFNNWAAAAHPEWQIRYADGTVWGDHGQRYGLCCPNNKEYREFLVEQMKEIGEQFPNLDGIFFDMPYWEVVCHCDACKARWEKEVGGPMPEKIDWQDERWRTLVKKRQQWMVEFAKYAETTTKRFLPNTTVELNFAAVVACDWLAGSTEGINEACEFTGGDLYGDLYNHSFTCKYYYEITKNQPFEYMTCRFNNKLRQHTITKPELELESEVMLAACHHGATLIIDAIDPDGGMDTRVYDRLGRVFAKMLPYDKYMNKGELDANVAVYFDSTTQFSSDGRPYNKECALSTARTLIENHIPFREIANGALDNLDRYKLIIAPALETFNNPEILKFIDYVKKGGTLYLSGKSDARLIKEFFGGEITGDTYGDTKYKHIYKGYNEDQCYVVATDPRYKEIFWDFNDKYPLPIIYKMPIMENFTGDVKAKIVLPYTDPDNNTIFASLHSNPPGIYTEHPAIIEKAYGKGKVIWSSANLEFDQRTNYKDIFASIVKDNVKPRFNFKASKYVEIITFKDGEDFYVNLFDLNFAFDLIKREYSLEIGDGYKAINLADGKELELSDGVLKGSFEKYVWLKLEKK